MTENEKNEMILLIGESDRWKVTKGNVAEWSKALALGASPKGRGFEPLHYQILLCYDTMFSYNTFT